MDFTYRIPKMRNWLSVYGEGFTEDEISPINEAPKSVWQGGLYLAKIPRANKFDLRLEGGYTSPTRGSFCTTCFYTNGQYNSGYNNDGYLIGTWIGRASQGELIRTNYWLSPRKKIGVELRHRKIDPQYLPQGGTQNDVAVNADIFAGPGFRFTGNLQYERWQIPLLATNRQNNVAASFRVRILATAALTMSNNTIRSPLVRLRRCCTAKQEAIGIAAHPFAARVTSTMQGLFDASPQMIEQELANIGDPS